VGLCSEAGVGLCSEAGVGLCSEAGVEPAIKQVLSAWTRVIFLVSQKPI
jgi:hypothetical protein